MRNDSVLSVSLASEDREMVAVEVERMLRLAEQCLERAKSFIGGRDEPPGLSAPTPSSCSAVQSETPNHTNTVLPAAPAANTGECVSSNQQQRFSNQAE